MIQGGNHMRIDGISNDTSYQPQKQQARTSGTESRPEVKQKSTPDRVKQTEIQHREAQMAAEVRSEKSEHEVIRAIEKANKQFRTFDRRLEFSIHDSTKQIMVKVINTNDDSVIREIPSEKVLDMVAHMWEVAGILVDEKR